MLKAETQPNELDPAVGWQSPTRAPLGTPQAPSFAQSRSSARPAPFIALLAVLTIPALVVLIGFWSQL